MSDCLFCKIVKGEIPSQKVFESEKVLAFKDLYPQAKNHVLFIHKSHTIDIADLIENDIDQVSDIFKGIGEYIKSEGIEKTGLRIVNNLGENGCQSVFHTHFHVLSGEKLSGGFGV